MSTSEPSPIARQPRRLWRWVLAVFGAGCLATVIVAYNLVTLSSDAAALRKEMTSALTGRPHVRVQLSVGPVLLSTVRAGLSLFPDIPPEARLALRSVENASVGVYELDHKRSAGDGARMLSAADEMMERRGWTRIVGVNDGKTVVLVYFPNDQKSKSTERVCLAVCDDKNLVVVSGKLRFEPLVQLALQQRLLASR